MHRKLRVLVGDSNVDLVQSTALLLRCWGHDVRVAFNGPAVLDWARSYRPDAVLMDLCLPGMDGFHVAQHLRRQDSLANLLLVAITGYGGEPYRRRAQEAGFDYHWLKPVDPEVLQRLLECRKLDLRTVSAPSAASALLSGKSKPLRSASWRPLLSLTCGG
jgi:CheY-like chemotaxis protein